MARSGVTSQDIKLVLVYAALGPLVGALAVVTGTLILLWIGSLMDGVSGSSQWDSMVTSGVLILLIGLVVGYIAGVVPAALAGVGSAVMSRHVPETSVWIGLNALVGLTSAGLVSVAFNLMIWGSTSSGSESGWLRGQVLGAALVPAIAGALAAVACAWVCRNFRPR